ncbi:hypothetical protein GGX14DRAFT_385737 [Mycena pura]|uniref:Uncharacterized protein n=1 Tax=Mycena pura TaxID=153505 RepID=A0AAD6YR88_9AGAR|nr:hypothetical protein GGX14DRAFT_385737 [Mycena pura]
MLKCRCDRQQSRASSGCANVTVLQCPVLWYSSSGYITVSSNSSRARQTGPIEGRVMPARSLRRYYSMREACVAQFNWAEPLATQSSWADYDRRASNQKTIDEVTKTVVTHRNFGHFGGATCLWSWNKTRDSLVNGLNGVKPMSVFEWGKLWANWLAKPSNWPASQWALILTQIHAQAKKKPVCSGASQKVHSPNAMKISKERKHI